MNNLLLRSRKEGGQTNKKAKKIIEFYNSQRTTKNRACRQKKGKRGSNGRARRVYCRFVREQRGTRKGRGKQIGRGGASGQGRAEKIRGAGRGGLWPRRILFFSLFLNLL